MNVRLYKFEAGMFRTGTLDHLRRKIEADPACRLESGQQVANATADLKHAPTRADQEAIDFLKPALVRSAPAIPFITFASDSIPMGDAGLPVNLSR